MKNKIKGIFLVVIICFGIVVYGCIVISGGLPKFIKDRSYVKVNYSLYPFDFTVNLGEYSLYVNKKVVTNVKDGTLNLTKNIGNKITYGANEVITKTSDVFKNLESKIR